MLGLKVQDNADFGAEIIRKVREGDGLSRVELARGLGVAASTIGRHVDALVGGGYFTENLEPTKEAGRPPTRLRPNPQRGCFLGVDFNATRLFATVVDFAQKPIAQESFPINGDKGVDVMLDEVGAALKAMQNAASMPVLAAGVATPGRVDTKRGIALNYSFVPGFENVPLGEHMHDIVKAPVFLENNIRTMALAERWFGAGRGYQDIICLGVRFGVSAGVIRKGELATGNLELGGQIRGWNCPVYDLAKDKWDWRPGATLEKHSNIPAVIARYTELSGKDATQSEFIQAARNGDESAIVALSEVAAIHGWAIAQMVQLIDPELVVLAGPLTTLGDVYLDAVNVIATQFESDYHPSVLIKASELGEYAGATGAAALALERWRPETIV